MCHRAGQTRSIVVLTKERYQLRGREQTLDVRIGPAEAALGGGGFLRVVDGVDPRQDADHVAVYDGGTFLIRIIAPTASSPGSNRFSSVV